MITEEIVKNGDYKRNVEALGLGICLTYKIHLNIPKKALQARSGLPLMK